MKTIFGIVLVHKINIKPLSVNKVWMGRRFKTQEYKEYEEQLLLLLPDLKIEDKIPLFLYIEFGFSNMASDYDNPLKPFVDILQKKYGFNDKWIMWGMQRKLIVPKSEEYIKFTIGKLLELTTFLKQIIKGL